MTNYDRIKAMSFEEMTEFLYMECDFFDNEENLKNWLLQEVNDENITKIEHNSLCETKTYKNK